jgi:glutathione S-transferase
MSLTVWGRLSSINVQKVTWTLDEIGLAYQHIPAGGDFGGLDDPAFRAMNPHGHVPVINDSGLVVWESNAIVRYLCARHDAFGAADAARRAQADQWMDWSATSLQPPMMAFFWGWYRTPEAYRDAQHNAAQLAETNRQWAVLNAVLARQPYLGGDAFGMADIPAGTLTYRWWRMAIDRPALPHLDAWRARLEARPAFQTWVMRPFEELYGRIAH